MKKKDQGITLIALVITIIVLLILAGVSIAMLTGQNGILTQAQNSKLVTTQAKVNEMTELAIGSLRTENLNDTSKITPQLVASQINKESNRTDVTASSTTFPSDMIFADEGMKSTVNIDLTVGSKDNTTSSTYYPASAGVDESKIAPAELFDFEPITETSSNNKIASTGDTTSLPQKEARITGIKTQYCNFGGYDKNGQVVAEDTNYVIKYDGITDTLIIPYQVEISGEMYKITEVDLSFYWKGLYDNEGYTNYPEIENIIYPNTVKKIIGGGIGGPQSSIKPKIILSENITEIPKRFFTGWYNGAQISKIELPKKLETIKESAFSNCNELEDIEIPSTVKTIGNSAFYHCEKLKGLELPREIERIGEYAFCDCSELSSVTYNGATYTSQSALKNALTENGVTVGYNPFAGTKLTN